MRSSRPSAGLVLLLCCALVAQATAEPAVESQVEANEEVPTPYESTPLPGTVLRIKVLYDRSINTCRFFVSYLKSARSRFCRNTSCRIRRTDSTVQGSILAVRALGDATLMTVLLQGEVATDGTTGPADPEAAADESVRFDYGRTDPEPLSMGSYSPATGGSKGDCAVLCQWEDYTPVCNANGRRVAQSACEARCVGLFSNQYSSAWCGVPKSGGGWFSGRKLRAFHA